MLVVAKFCDPECEDYLAWERDMDVYFEQNMGFDSERCQFKFAKAKLVHQARLDWDNVERILRLEGHEPITTWSDMKLELRMYLP